MLYVTEEDTAKIWKERYEEQGLDDTDHLTVQSLAKVLPYPDACQLGSDGLLRAMLVANASHMCYASFAIKAIVSYKWRSVLKPNPQLKQ